MSDCGGCEPIDETFRIKDTATYLVENRTPYDIEVDHGDRHLSVPALGVRVMSGRRLGCFSPQLYGLRQRHQLRVREYVEPSLGTGLVGVIALFGFVAIPFVVLVRFVQAGTLLDPLTGRLFFGALGTTVVAGVYWYAADYRDRKRQERADRVDGDAGLSLGGISTSDAEMGQRLWNAGVLLVMTAVGIVLPATWLYFGTDLHTIASFDSGLAIDTRDAGEAAWRSIQVMYVVVLVTLPAMLFFLFDRIRVGSLRPQWWRDLFRLDHRLGTLADLHARYGHKLTEGNGHGSGAFRTAGGKRSPIIVATILFAVGWTILVLPTKSRDVTEEVAADRAAVAASTAEAAAAAAQSSGDSEELAAAAQQASDAREIATNAATEAVEMAPTDPDSSRATTAGELTDRQLAEQAAADAAEARDAATIAAIAAEESGGGGRFQIFDPDPSAATAAFLGAYFFSLFVALRGFSRRDLNPKMYVAMAARVAIASSVAFLVVVVTPWGESPPAIAVAFLAGVTPTPVIGAILTAPLNLLAGRVPGESDDSSTASARPPDANLEGATTSTRRLGLTWLRRLTRQVDDAMADRRPLSVLDHVDIFERARLEAEGLGDVEALAHGDIVQLMVATRIPTARLIDWIDQAMLMIHLEPPSSSKAPTERVARLRALGLRTATDLVVAVEAARADSCSDSAACLDELVATFDGSRSALDVVMMTLQMESNFPYVKGWRTSPLGDPHADRPVLGPDGLTWRPYGSRPAGSYGLAT